MKKILKRFYKRFVSPIIQIRPKNIGNYFTYRQHVISYQSLGGKIHSLWPILGEDTATTSIDPHYFYQGIWAARHIIAAHPNRHIDIGSQVDLVGFLSTVMPVTFVDVRPLDVTVENLTSIKGNILNLPFTDSSVGSLSCLHVAEHIGLGRYGDPLDPQGTQKACRELSRVLAPGGKLYFSLPIGKERTEFNAHRVHTPKTILSYFSNLKLVDFSAVDDRGHLIERADITAFDQARYACGLFLFTKEEKKS